MQLIIDFLNVLELFDVSVDLDVIIRKLIVYSDVFEENGKLA